MYFGTINGLFRKFPGTENSKTSESYGASGYDHIGCYKDTSDRAFDDYISGADITIEQCFEKCSEYIYFALQDGNGGNKGECRCGNSFSDATQYGTSSDCDKSTTGTGWAWANDLYQIRQANVQYNSYDPRFRPWYVSAASGSKNVVILLDISGSMEDEGRMDLAKQAVILVLQTLGQSSMVSVVAFNHDVELSCFGEEFVAATTRNVAKLIEFVEGLTASGGTNFDKVSFLLSSIPSNHR